MQNVITIENGVTRHPLYRMKEVPTAADPEADCFTFLPNFDTDIFFENFLVPAYVSFQAIEHHVDLNLFYRYIRFSEFNQV